MASPLSHHFATMAYNNAWANHRLQTACAKLSQSDFVAPRTSFFPSLKATLNHIVTVDWYYIDALERALAGREPNREPDRFFDPEEPCMGIQTEPATRLLAHLFQHQIHHRGQAHAMLAGTKVKPPQLDEFFCANEAHLRAAELAELGYSEDLIWK